MNSVVSIIVPIHNTGRHLSDCIESLINQTYAGIEIILINDASTDGSLAIALKYATLDKRIKLIELSENIGVDKARYRGLKDCSGDYIMFVDSDDCIYTDSVEILITAAKSQNSDVVEGCMKRVFGRCSLFSKVEHKINQHLEQPELFNDYYISFFGRNLLSVNLYGKMYKKEIFDTAKPVPTGMRMGEDLMVNMQIFPYIKKYQLINKLVYKYRYGGMTSRFNPYLWPDLKAQYFYKMDMIEKYGYVKAINSAKIEMCNVLYSNVMQMFIFKRPKSEIELFIKNEMNSGFVDEITAEVDYDRSYFMFLKEKNVHELMNICEKASRIRRVKRQIFCLMARVLS